MPVSLKEALDEYYVVLETSELAKRTVSTNINSLRQFKKWADNTEDFPLDDISQIKAKHMRLFFHHRKVNQGVGAGARQQNYIHLNSFFKWLTKEYKKELKKNPLAKVDRPSYKPPVIEFPLADTIDKMISTCDHTFKGTRDRLLLCLFKETGGRANEILSLEEKDIHEVEQYIDIRFGKGGKTREVPYGEDTAVAIIAYKAARKEHRLAHLPAFFLGYQAPLQYDGLNNMFKDRSFEVSGEEITPHKLRHWFVHLAKERGVSEDALMELMGWSTRTMLDRYALSMRKERAHQEYRKKLSGKEV